MENTENTYTKLTDAEIVVEFANPTYVGPQGP